MVETSFLPSQPALPVVVKPCAEGLNLAAWALRSRDYIEALLGRHKAILFRGFDVAAGDGFEPFVMASSDAHLLEYRDRSSPRHEVSNRIYTSTDYPADQSIFLHNEGTYWLEWPLKIYFHCVTPAERGGETPIADCRRIFERIGEKIRGRFIEKQVLYIRNYNDGFGLNWQEVFQTTDKSVVDDYCKANDIQAEWKEGGRLRTRAVRPAVAVCPRSGEMTWFNHATFFHVSTLPPGVREPLLAEFREEDLPTNTYYGDGSAIEPSVLDELRDAYDQEKISFPWQKGDVLMLENMLVAHGREPYSGARRVLVAMAEPFGR